MSWEDDITKENGIEILTKGTEFYHKDHDLVRLIEEQMEEHNRKYAISRKVRYPQRGGSGRVIKKIPVLIANKTGVDPQFEEGIYMIGNNPVPQLICPVVIGNWLVYQIDFV